MRLELALLFFFSVFRDVWVSHVGITRSFASLTSQAVSDAVYVPAFTLSGLKEGVRAGQEAEA